MAKLENLTAVSDVADEDLFYVVKDPDGTPLDRKVTAANARKTPSRVVFVDGRYTANVTPYFDNISDALTAANAMSPTVSNPVTIKAFSDTDGSPIGLGDNDYYTLRDSGIVFESSYDPMQLLFKGGEVIEDEFLYEYKESEMNIEVTL
jgi:hypothetical protein